jgi:pimeloyl-ACP methyl ester carboxylesterase
MPFADNKGVKIHYEVEGEGDPIVLVHGFSANMHHWVNLRYVAALVPNYECILVDARGHGRSDKPHDVAAYSAQEKVDDIIAILNDLDVHRAHFWGYSMGGMLGLAVATLGGDRFKSVVVGGAAPGPNPPERFNQLAGLLEGGMDPYLQTVPVELRFGVRNNDAEALRATALATAADPQFDLEAPIAPVLVYNGGDDPAAARAKAMASKTPPIVHYHEFPGLDHRMGFQRSDVVLPTVLPFLSKASRGALDEVKA